MGSAQALLTLFAAGGRRWMLPVLILVALLAIGLVLVGAIPHLTPFIYVAE